MSDIEDSVSLADLPVHDYKTGRTRRWPWFALYVDTASHANDVAAALRSAIRQCGG
jgi:hypothetical protein